MDTTALIGTAATAASVSSFVPQVWKIIKSRDTSSISLKMYAVTVTGFTLWATYGFLLGTWPIIVANLLCLALSGFILTMKVLPQDRKEWLASLIGPSRDTGYS